MDLLKIFEKTESDKKDNDEPERTQNKRYRLCVEDNPDERKYRCGKRDVMVPNCKLSLSLEELTYTQAREIELQIRNMLEADGFIMR